MKPKQLATPDIKSLVSKTVRSRHGPLYMAMFADYDAISAAFKRGRPNWAALLAGLQEIGIPSGTGTPLTLRTVQQTWYRVKADRRWHPSPPTAPSSPSLLAAIQRSATPDAEPDQPEAPRPKPKIDFRPATTRAVEEK